MSESKRALPAHKGHKPAPPAPVFVELTKLPGYEEAFPVDGLADDAGPALIGRPEEWTERALCSQVDPDMFFPPKGGSTAEAKAICGRCPVQPECLEYALEHDERFGVWGGVPETRRRGMRRERNRQRDAQARAVAA